ncbi:Protein RET-1 g [Aphelenchoides avenae]|nr:Protein RET-1 g [Aphelenchus avenae]
MDNHFYSNGPMHPDAEHLNGPTASNDPNQHVDRDVQHLPVGRTSESASSQDSNGSTDFVKIDHNDLAEIPNDLLVDYGSRMADEVLGNVLGNDEHVGGAGDSTPANESISPLSNIMDERDLALPPGAAAAELHPAPGEHVHLPFEPEKSRHHEGLAEEGHLQPHHHEIRHDVNLDEFDPLIQRHIAEVQAHGDPKHPEETHSQPQLFGNSPIGEATELDTIVESQAAESEAQPSPDSEQERAEYQHHKEPSPEHAAHQVPQAEPHESSIGARKDEGHHEQAVPSHETPSHPNQDVHHAEASKPMDDQSKDIEESIQEAVNDVHEDVDAVLEKLTHAQEEQPQEEQYSPTAESGGDTLGGLIGDEESPREQRGIPESESVQGMRELSPDEGTYERKGPLTIPAAVSGSQSQRRETEETEEIKPYGHVGLEPRPPTPPKDLSEPSEEKPSVVDLGPPPHPHTIHRGSSEKQLHPILKHGSSTGPWVSCQHVDPRVLEIIYWRDPKKSGIALAAILVAIFLVAKLPLISLVAYSALAILAGTLGFRVFKLAESQVKKTDPSNPFNPYLERDIVVPQEKVHAQVDVFVEHVQNAVVQLRRLFLVENLVDSIKFGLLLWTLTYIGAWFSGLALVIIFVLGVFSVPKFYEVYKEPIDQYLGLARENVENVNNIIHEKLPFLKKAQTRVAQEAKKEE